MKYSSVMQLRLLEVMSDGEKIHLIFECVHMDLWMYWKYKNRFRKDIPQELYASNSEWCCISTFTQNTSRGSIAREYIDRYQKDGKSLECTAKLTIHTPEEVLHI